MLPAWATVMSACKSCSLIRRSIRSTRGMAIHTDLISHHPIIAFPLYDCIGYSTVGDARISWRQVAGRSNTDRRSSDEHAPQNHLCDGALICGPGLWSTF